MTYVGEHLLSTPVFATPTYGLPRAEKTKLAYERARALIQTYRTSYFSVPTLPETDLIRQG